jgi:YHS domain-containing protein
VTDVTEARDPICGMLVEIATAQYRSRAADGIVYFCCRGCQQRFEKSGAGSM